MENGLDNEMVLFESVVIPLNKDTLALMYFMHIIQTLLYSIFSSVGFDLASDGVLETGLVFINPCISCRMDILTIFF